MKVAAGMRPKENDLLWVSRLDQEACSVVEQRVDWRGGHPVDVMGHQSLISLEDMFYSGYNRASAGGSGGSGQRCSSDLRMALGIDTISSTDMVPAEAVIACGPRVSCGTG